MSGASPEEPLDSLARDLLALQSESRSLDYKGAMSFGPEKRAKGEFIRDILAFSNTQDGGQILIGVAESNGHFTPEAMSDEQVSSFDPTIIGTFARNYCSALPDLRVNRVSIDNSLALLVTILPFSGEPLVCTKDLSDANSRLVLRAGTVYARTNDARSAPIETAEDMGRLLRLAVSRQGDALLAQVRALVGAIPEGQVPDESQYVAQLQSATQFLDDKVPTEPWWQVVVSPAQYNPELITSREELREIRRQAEVSIRGWNFPHTDHNHDENFEDGIQSYTGSGRYEEAHRIYRSGLFIWRRVPWEELTEGYEGRLNYLGAIASMTEYFLFASRLSEMLSDLGQVDITVTLAGIKGRRLYEDRGLLLHDYISGAERFHRTARLSLAELRSNHLEIAVRWCRDLFELFNASITETVIVDWQQKFLNRQF